MAKSRREYFRRTRKVRVRELHHSKAGWTGFICGMGSLIFFWTAVILSFFSEGNARFYVGSLGLIGLVLAIGGFIMCLMGAREEKARLIIPRAGMAVGAGMTVLYVGLFIYGF